MNAHAFPAVAEPAQAPAGEGTPAVPEARAERSEPAGGVAEPGLLQTRQRRRSVALYLGPGQRIAGRYEIVQVLGEGGMGVVYRCRDRGGEACAVKRVVLPESNPDEHLAWFLAEARALSALNHPNIVRARDFGQLCDGTPYLAMDLVDGVLWQQLGIEPASFPVLWRIVDQVLAALAHAHARGIVHGDLKPSNVVVDIDEPGELRARLFDFGLAKRRRCELDPRLVERSSFREPPSSAGTPGYMAPEQILGRTSEISGATDLYALGCILYRVVAGRPLAQTETRRDRDFQSFQEPPRPPPLPGLPEGLVDFVMTLLVRQPWRRLASAPQARQTWQRFRPSAPVDLSGVVASLLARDVEQPENSERTRRIGPRRSRASSTRLGRSKRWLPGLLSVRPAPLIGRGDYQRLLKDLGERVARPGEEPRRAVILSGPAGVGKSRLAAWLATELEEQGVALSLRGFRNVASTVRDPLALALSARFAMGQGALRLLPSGVLEQCDEADVGAVVDWVLQSHRPELFGSAQGESLAPRLLRVLGAVAQGRPLLLWLDDLAAISAGTWAALLSAHELQPSLRFVLISTVETSALGQPALKDVVRSLTKVMPIDCVPVAPLDALATSELLRAAHPIDPARALALALESGGIPLDALARLYALARRSS